MQVDDLSSWTHWDMSSEEVQAKIDDEVLKKICKDNTTFVFSKQSAAHESDEEEVKKET